MSKYNDQWVLSVLPIYMTKGAQMLMMAYYDRCSGFTDSVPSWSNSGSGMYHAEIT